MIEIKHKNKKIINKYNIKFNSLNKDRLGIDLVKNPLFYSKLDKMEKQLEKEEIKSVAIMSNDTKNYPEDSFENMISFSKLHDFSFPYLIDETQNVAKEYGAVCTPDFFGYNKNLELQYRGRIRELKDLKPVREDDSDLKVAMKLVAETGKGPKNQIPSMGCNIKWFK